jgi:hypothetical protein
VAGIGSASRGAANQMVRQRAQRTERPAAPSAAGASVNEVSQLGQVRSMLIRAGLAGTLATGR